MFRTQTGQTGRSAYVNELAAIGNEFRALSERYAKLGQAIADEMPDTATGSMNIASRACPDARKPVKAETLRKLVVSCAELDCTRSSFDRLADLIGHMSEYAPIDPETKPATVPVTIIGPNLRDQSKGSFHVHASGCADIAKTARRDPAYADASWTIEASTRDDVVLEVYSDMIEDNDRDPIEDYRDDLYFFPCCTQLPQS
jgi:hypothetical protein